MGIWLSWKKKTDFRLYLLALVFISCLDVGNSLQLVGFNQVNGSYISDILSIYSKTNSTLRLYGNGLISNETRVALVAEKREKGFECDDEKDSNAFHLEDPMGHSALITVNHNVIEKTEYYFCIKANDSSRFVHQGTEKWLTIFVMPLPEPVPETLLPLPLQIIIICILLMLSGIFSGLNLGLMSLDPMELQIIMKSGTPSEQKFASIIYPIRKKGNFLLCTLLLGNVLVNNTLTILLSDITSGTLAIIASTAAIVVFGEIVPQALCSRYGLHVGAYTIWLTRVFMVLTFVVSYPISKILDLILGKEIGTVYNRKKLLEMLKVTDPYNDLATDEVQIIQGALELRSKTVEAAMTPINDCFMVEQCSVLNFEQASLSFGCPSLELNVRTDSVKSFPGIWIQDHQNHLHCHLNPFELYSQTMREIMSTGYTRIPVYEGERTNVVSILFVKDLAFVDPDDCMPLKTVCKFYQHRLHFVFNDTTLDKLLEEFKIGTFHMAIVQVVHNEGPVDPYYEVVGIITLEDVIEEIIKSEIVDETDLYTDNTKKKLNMARQKIPLDLSLFTDQPGEGRKLVVTPQILLAAHRFLLAEVDPFKTLLDKVLLRLLKQDVVVVLSAPSEHEHKSDKQLIYKKSKASDYFVLVLEGQVKVVVGKENLEFQGGPFSYYGVPALMPPSAPPSSVLPPKNSHSRTNSLTRGSIVHHDPPVAEMNMPHSATSASLSEAGIPHSQLFYPDYDLIAVTDVKYVKISRKQYLNAVRATKMAEAGNIQEDEVEPPDDVPLIRNSSKKSLSSRTDSIPNRNKNNSYDHESGCKTTVEEFDISQSHPDLAPARHRRAPHLRFQNKSMSSGQLMAMAAKYATIAGDRIHPSALMRSLAGSDKEDMNVAEGEATNVKPPQSPPDASPSKASEIPPETPPPAYGNNSEDRTLLNSL